MTEQEAIGYLKTLPNRIPLKFFTDDGAKVYDEFSQVVTSALEKQKDNGWIPCSERFPDTDKYILLSFSNFSIPLAGRYKEDEDGSGTFYIGDEMETCLSQDLFVNAWMYLPEPYKESEKE